MNPLEKWGRYRRAEQWSNLRSNGCSLEEIAEAWAVEREFIIHEIYCWVMSQ